MSATDPAGGGTVFETADADLAGAWLTATHAPGLRLGGLAPGAVFRLRQTMLGDVAFQHGDYPVDMTVTTEPSQRLHIVHVRAGVVDREVGGVDERFGPGDILLSPPGLSCSSHLRNLTWDVLSLDLALVREVAATSPDDVPAQLQFTGYRPASPAAGRSWLTTVAHARSIAANPEAAASPLIVGSVRRLLAAGALATFPNTVVVGPTPRDTDATPTLRRAIAFIEARAGDDIGLTDIAGAACVTARAVQIAFRRHLDTTPMAYLRRVRLDQAREELRAAEPGATVTIIAARWGFASPSRFTVDYRAAYGELPSHTLRGQV